MRTAHSAAREACSGSSQRAKNGAARSLATSRTRSRSAEGEVGQDGAGLVHQQVGQRPVRPSRRADSTMPATSTSSRSVGLAHGDGQGREQPGHLGLDDGGEDALLAPGEGPVDRGPGQAGRPGDVVHRGLGDPLAGQAAQGAVDDADPGRRAVVGPRWRTTPSRSPVGEPVSTASARVAAAPTDETVWRFLSHCQPVGRRASALTEVEVARGDPGDEEAPAARGRPRSPRP